MSEADQLDLIVVGAGLAGLACAHEAAAAGLQVAVLERGDLAGGKNLTGGKLYLEPVNQLCPGLLEGAPLERPVVSESFVLTDDRQSVSFRLDHEAEEGAPHSVTVLSSPLLKHLADRAAEKGALVLCQQRAESLVKDGEVVVGVKVGPEELRARTVVAADGCLSFLAEEAGLRTQRPVRTMGIGVKELIQLDSGLIEERFNLPPGQGASRIYLGRVTEGLAGGGFLYTNRETISLGLVLNLKSLQDWQSGTEVWELMETFKERPDIAPLIAGGTTVEYGAHLVPEGGFPLLPARGVPGLLLAGDAAGLVLNTGLTLRGMDLALASGAIAGRSAVEAVQGGLDPAACLEHYARALDQSFVIPQMRDHGKAADLLFLDRLYHHYPQKFVQWVRESLQVGSDGRSSSPSKALKKLRRNVLGWRGYQDFWRLSRM